MSKVSNQVATQIALIQVEKTGHVDSMNLTTTATYYILLDYWNWLIIILLLLILGIMIVKRD